MYDILSKGGGLVYPILFCSVLALAIFLQRYYTFFRFQSGNRELNDKLHPLIQDGLYKEALDYCLLTNSAMSRVYATAFRQVGKPRAQIKAVVEEVGMREVAPLERYLGLLGTIATISPLLGLLGTVIGMIKAFNVLAIEGVGTPASLGGGISEALITTAAGLAVAIPTLLMHKYLTGRVDRMTLDMEDKALRVVDLLGD